MTASSATALAALLVAAVAAVVDASRGRIPAWLTWPALVLGPLGWGLAGGAMPLAYALVSAVACGLVPLVLYARGAMGGGDVKLAAALGGLVGARPGLEILLVAFTTVAIVAVGRLVWHGELAGTLLRIALALVPPRAGEARSRVLPDALRRRVRFAPWVFVGALLALGPALLSD